MDQTIRDFVDFEKAKYLKKKQVIITLETVIKSHNHEIWRKCKCGNEEDLRSTVHCSKCGSLIFNINHSHHDNTTTHNAT